MLVPADREAYPILAPICGFWTDVYLHLQSLAVTVFIKFAIAQTTMKFLRLEPDLDSGNTLWSQRSLLNQSELNLVASKPKSIKDL